MTSLDTAQAPPTSPTNPKKPRRGPDSLAGILVKIVLLGLVDAFAVYVMIVLFMSQNWTVLVVAALVTGLVNWIYLRKGGLPAKYLAPGVFFLAIFQICVVAFTGYIAFTNYGDGHNSSKADAISAIQRAAQQRVPDSPSYRVAVLGQGENFYLLLTGPDGKTLIGGDGKPAEKIESVQRDSTGKAIGVDGYSTLNLRQILANQNKITSLDVPLSPNAADGSLRTADGSNAYIYRPTRTYDPATDTFKDTASGKIYHDGGHGNFVDDAGTALEPGWKIDVGFSNFTKAFTDDNLRGPLLQVAAWTITFALASVVTTFVMGLFLAITFNRQDLRGKRIYRILIILPYAFPVFLSGLVWSGLLNQEFGFINQALLGGAQIPWLSDPWLAKFSVLLVNLWLGFPYMFLVCTGALQSLPEELDEAARVDGASAWRIFRSIKLPLLLVSVAPLLISTFAFNFNNFNVIYMLTAGGPRFQGTTMDIGATDILITMVYKVAFGGGAGRDYGLASALAILIFIIVAVISAWSFKMTKSLEEVNS
ncbi:ABC transporter permease subunit [Arthrobacter sp. NicSoilB11]|uniref:ABC transporter permease subunit n=1 Tax=Arthrobacter sp. NicSoilB11 TaxID=2830999 RepID=UPI001CC51AA2|nr:ABC transporter permease subunit [Arthrobacter sp. NicSoilB11]BCW77827.1 sugar ABC transporter permease [Arthrobacter sp. NicSoilB11]